MDVEIVEISPYLNMSEKVFFRKNTYLVRKEFYLAFFDMGKPRHMYSVTKHDRKIVFGRVGLVQLKFHFLAPGRLFVEFLLYEKIHEKQ